MQILKLTAAAAFALALSACATTQLTSGGDYLARYTPSAATSNLSIDQDIRDIAAIEPDLRFPARIGLARIHKQNLINTPGSELAIWGELAESLGPQTGEFVPVSPLIAAMVRPAANPKNRNAQREHVVADIRRAAARQHLDYVLLYEVTDSMDSKSNALALADLTILGLYVLPTRNTKIKSTASALLIDVRNGYPYGTASALTEDTKATTRAASRGYRDKALEKTSIETVEKLADDVESMMTELKMKMG